MITPVVRFVVRDGSGSLPLGSVAWRWSSGDDVTVQGRLVAQDGTPIALSTDTGDALALAFWKQDQSSSDPYFQVDAVRLSDDEPSLILFTIPSGTLEPGEYEVGARYRVLFTYDQVLAQSRLVVDADRAVFT
jgi:hypothetical protein